MKFSICIPTYEMKGVGDQLLNKLMRSIKNQTFTDYEIIISDHSKSDIISNTLHNWSDLDVKYFKYEENRGNSSHNMNNAIKHATGEFIKIMHQDDFFYDKTCLEEINNAILKNPNLNWGYCKFNHTSDGETYYRTIQPIYKDQIIYAKNSIGAPSVMFFKNDDNYFDSNLIWMNDCEISYRLNKKYGSPISIHDKIYITIRTWENSVTNSIVNDSIIKFEKEHCLKKYNLV